MGGLGRVMVGDEGKTGWSVGDVLYLKITTRDFCVG